MTTDDIDRRKKLRVDFKTTIFLKTDLSEIHIEGNSKDLSLKGMFIHTREETAIGTKCRIEVNLTGMTEPLSLHMQGKIVRKDLNGIAVEFDSMDLDSYTHLKNLVRYNTADPDDVQ
ncbi:MAG: PilZ domain-containing protein [Deltaproteobacteria bacterium]|nr:MAG: PilZ domain-containing protein [Deltaproteobacteria bacterium]